jgi:hypothetical protein
MGSSPEFTFTTRGRTGDLCLDTLDLGVEFWELGALAVLETANDSMQRRHVTEKRRRVSPLSSNA